jgi:hypothetical protein
MIAQAIARHTPPPVSLANLATGEPHYCKWFSRGSISAKFDQEHLVWSDGNGRC